jgi:hypothetical protein
MTGSTEDRDRTSFSAGLGMIACWAVEAWTLWLEAKAATGMMVGLGLTMPPSWTHPDL